MNESIHLNVNRVEKKLTLNPETPLLFALRNDLNLKGAKLGCGLEQCHACTVLIDGAAVPSCKIPVSQIEGLQITTLEGLGTPDNLHDLQAAFIDQQAIQCGTCVNGMIMAAEGLLRRERYPTDDQIKESLERNLCRCGVYDRVRRAIHLRTGREISKQWSVVSDELSEGREAGGGLSTESVEHEFDNLRSLKINPQLDSWIKIEDGGAVTVMTGKVEIGQGLKTAVAQIAAEELDVAFERINVIDADTRITPNEGITAGSMSMETTGRAIRQAAADARHILLKLAFEELEAETPAKELIVRDGTISDPVTGRQTDYWHLHADRPFGVAVSGVGQPKSPADYTVIGQPLERTDLVGKVTGTFEYLHDLELPNMVHARIVRPPRPTSVLKQIDLNSVSVKELNGVLKIVQDGSFLGVICEREEQAIWAAEKLYRLAEWEHVNATRDTHQNIYEVMRSSPSINFAVVDGIGVEGPPPERQPLTQNAIRATYHRPFGMHASLLPSVAVAHAEPDSDKMTLYVQTQGVFPQRDTIAPVLGIDPADLTVIHMEGAGCYGNNGADDCAMDTALLARAFPGRPIMLKWTRADEHGREPYTSPMIVEMAAELDEKGSITHWHHDVWSYTHLNRPTPGAEHSAFIAAQEIANGKPKPPEAPRYIRPWIQGGKNTKARALTSWPLRRSQRRRNEH
ncbi:MAG: molybdopterin cofactor-binding domain-containing protein [Chloroflexota bacterium]